MIRYEMFDFVDVFQDLEKYIWPCVCSTEANDGTSDNETNRLVVQVVKWGLWNRKKEETQTPNKNVQICKANLSFPYQIVQFPQSGNIFVSSEVSWPPWIDLFWPETYGSQMNELKRKYC